MRAGVLNYRNREERWRTYHKFEQKGKALFFKKISTSDGFKILKELHLFAIKLKNKSKSRKLDMDKIKALANVHFLFGRVKP